MAKRYNKKLLILSLVALIGFASIATIFSYILSRAAEGGTGVGSDTPENNSIKTNIDYIIDFSNNGDDPDTENFIDDKYYIVEIGAGNESSLKGFSAGDADNPSGFNKYVVTGNKTVAIQPNDMRNGSVDYSFYSLSSLQTESGRQAALTAIANADLIYLSMDPDTNQKFDKNHDLPEDVRIALDNHAIAYYKPFIVDSPRLTNQINPTDVNGIANLVTEYRQSGSSRGAFEWDTTSCSTANDFFSRQGNSLYVQIRGNKRINNWFPVYADAQSQDGEGNDIGYAEIKDPSSEKPSCMTKILTITGNSSDTAMTDKVLSGMTKTNISIADESATITEVEGVKYASAVTTVNDVYKVTNADSFYNAYYLYELHPDYVKHDTVVYDVASSNLKDVDLDQYDMIIIEGSMNAKTLVSDANGVDDYSKLLGAMYASKQILYSSTLDGVTISKELRQKTGAVNFDTLYEKIVSNNDKARYDNILVSSRKKMNVYTSAEIPSAEKDIVKIINNGRFRGIGSGGEESTNKFTVLEIQPMYPIDTELASRLTKYIGVGANSAGKTDFIKGHSEFYDPGFYYLITDGVLNDTTSDEITLDGTTSLTEMEKSGAAALQNFIDNDDASNSDSPVAANNYYQWEWSRAKVLHLINQLPEFSDYTYDMVKVVHMSTQEFNASKATLTDNYDMIYIGGNNSAIKSEGYFQANPNNVKPDQLSYKNYSANYYNMYYHIGDIGHFDTKYFNENGGEVGVELGNDITLLKKEALEKYVKAGMMVVFSQDVCEAYRTAEAQTYNQHKIDPDSNIYKFFSECISTSGVYYGLENVLLDFNQKDIIQIPNPNNAYGNTYSGYVTVFGPGKSGETDYQNNLLGTVDNGINENELKGRLLMSSLRPKFTLVSAPTPYNEYDPSTFIKGNKLTFKLDMISKNSNYVANVYYDDNGNSRFEENECVVVEYPIKTNGDTTTIESPVADGFHEGVYWKLEVVDKAGKATSSTTGVCKMAIESDEKILIDVLEIVPDNNRAFGTQGENTLMFCTECQRFNTLFEGNVGMNSAKWYTNQSHEGQTTALQGDAANTGNHFRSISQPTAVVNKLKSYDSSYSYKGNALGVHDHRFGIVKYGTDLSWAEYDDWSSNWADNLLDEYDFNLNIIGVSQYDDLMTKIADEYSSYSTLDEKLEHRDKLLSGYEENDQKIEGAADFRNYYLCMHYIMSGQLQVSVDVSGKLVCTDTKGLVTDEDFAKFSTKLAAMNIAPADMVTYSTSKGRLDTIIDNEVIPQANELAPMPQTAQFMETFTHDLTAMKKYDTYYNFFSLINEAKDGNTSGSAMKSYIPAFMQWRDGKIIESYFKDKWTELQYICSLDNDGNVDLSGMYSTIIVGCAEYFAHQDLSVESCESLVNYTEHDGKILLLHDSINGTTENTNLSKYFRQLAGQDARHLNVEYKSNNMIHAANTVTVKVGKSNASYNLPWNVRDLNVQVSVGDPKLKDSIYLCVETIASYGKLKNQEVSTINPKHTHYNMNIYYHADGTINDITVTPADDDTVEDTAHNIVVTTKLYGMDYHPPVYSELSAGNVGNVQSVGYVTDSSLINDVSNFTSFRSGKDITIPNYEVGDATITFNEGAVKFADSDYAKQKVIVNSTVPVDVTCKINNTANNVSSSMDSGNQVFEFNNYYIPNTAGQTPVFDVKDSYLEWHDGESYTSADKEAALKKFYISKLSPSGEVNYTVEPTALTMKSYQTYPDNAGHKAVFMTKYSIYYANDCEGVQAQDKQFNHSLFLTQGKVMTDRAKQNNKALVTSYPFAISDSLKLGGTHSQTYALDLEDDDLTVWYSLCGGTHGTISSSLAANPMDGQNSYYIYTYNNVTYCGAGHLPLTGHNAENNDERRLLINVIINNARKSAIGTRVNLYDPDATQDSIGNPDINNNKKIIDNGDGSYLLEVSDELAMPEFSFIATADTKSGSQIKQVQIYYDLDLNNGMEPHTYTADDENHILVYDTGNLLAQNVDFSGILKYATYDEKNSYFKTTTGNPITASTPASELQLKLKPGYIRTHSDGEDYTYLVVKVTTFKDGKETTVYRKIKIVPKPFLFDLT